MSVISGVTSALTGADATRSAASTSSDSAMYAADKSYAAQEDSLKLAKDQYNTTRADFQPYADVGKAAIPTYQSMLNGTYDMKQSPAAQYQLTQGTKALNRAQASRGLSGSGSSVSRLTDLNSSIAASDWSNQYSRILDALKLGTGASSSMGSASNTLTNASTSNASQTSNTATSLANQLSNIYTQQGTNRASLYSGLGGQTSNAAATGINAYKAYNSNNSMSGDDAMSTYYNNVPALLAE